MSGTPRLINAAALCDGARRVAQDPLTIETPAQQWAYAVLFDLPGDGVSPGDAIAVTAEIEVSRGEAGIGLLNLDQTAFHVERHIVADDGPMTVVLTLRPEQQTRRLVVRNFSAASESVVAIRRVVLDHVHAPEETVPVFKLSPELFKNFKCFSGSVPAGFSVNWLGVLTRPEMWPYANEINASYPRDREEVCRYPLSDVFDWVPLLETVTSSKTVFRMVALGAGWGCGLTAGAFAARQLGLSFHLTGVEAEPQHFAWLQQHLRDNNLSDDCVRLIHGAASPGSEPCWFPVSDPHCYGYSIVAQAPGSAIDSEEAVVDGMRLRRVAAVSLEDIVGPEPVDYLTLDIQGTEFDFLASNPDRLQRFVRMVNIGTHSLVIERQLRRLFKSLGWTSRYDFSLDATLDVQLDGVGVRRVYSEDGLQVWCNPAFQETRR